MFPQRAVFQATRRTLSNEHFKRKSLFGTQKDDGWRTAPFWLQTPNPFEKPYFMIGVGCGLAVIQRAFSE